MMNLSEMPYMKTTIAGQTRVLPFSGVASLIGGLPPSFSSFNGKGDVCGYYNGRMMDQGHDPINAYPGLHQCDCLDNFQLILCV
jgi:hypothetical protein